MWTDCACRWDCACVFGHVPRACCGSHGLEQQSMPVAPLRWFQCCCASRLSAMTQPAHGPWVADPEAVVHHHLPQGAQRAPRTQQGPSLPLAVHYHPTPPPPITTHTTRRRVRVLPLAHHTSTHTIKCHHLITPRRRVRVHAPLRLPAHARHLRPRGCVLLLLSQSCALTQCTPGRAWLGLIAAAPIQARPLTSMLHVFADWSRV